MKNGRKSGVERPQAEGLVAPEAGPLTVEVPRDEATNGHARTNGKRRAPLLPELASVLEAVLFATDKPVTLEQLRYALPEAEPEAIEATLNAMEARYLENGAGFRLYRLAGGFQLRTAPELHSYVERFLVGKRRSRLSRAALETLAAVAYRQPITRGDLEDLRGVDCGQVLHTLMERNLVATTGRSEALGRPLLYGTTDEFLSYFGLSSLNDLPSLEEFQSLLGDDPLQDPEIREALLSQGMWEEEAAPESPALSLIVGGQDDATEETTNDAGSNGHAQDSNGHATNGDHTNGHGANGHSSNGSAPNGNESNGDASNGNASIRDAGDPEVVLDSPWDTADELTWDELGGDPSSAGAESAAEIGASVESEAGTPVTQRAADGSDPR